MRPIETGQPVAFRHPLADEEERFEHGRRLTLRGLLGGRDSDLWRCRAANRILGSLGNPGLAAATHVERDADRRLVLTYETDDREPLSARLSDAPAFVEHVLIQLCAALEAAHSLGIVHGALTPGAVRLGHDPHRPSVTLADFGLGHLFGAKSALEGGQSWRPHSPEKEQGLEPTPREDVYLLGALGYTMLTGRPLFDSTSRPQTLRKHATETRSGVTPGSLPCAPALAAIVQRCLSKNPSERFSGPAEVAHALLARAPEAQLPPRPGQRPAVVGDVLSAVAPFPLPIPPGVPGDSKRLAAMIIASTLVVTGVTWAAVSSLPTDPSPRSNAAGAADEPTRASAAAPSTITAATEADLRPAALLRGP